ncbi:hypothetical protein L6452_10094 [Arctium lappa]|uniref:Uncharacterized protein n=1 Tax=Arctium lappa TaxID=4217 RepID=A0ACB9DM14_ARCLA|nr:hypothetical protein L6452_10094 [Arctium lappa]
MKEEDDRDLYQDRGQGRPTVVRQRAGRPAVVRQRAGRPAVVRQRTGTIDDGEAEGCDDRRWEVERGNWPAMGANWPTMGGRESQLADDGRQSGS